MEGSLAFSQLIPQAWRGRVPGADRWGLIACAALFVGTLWTFHPALRNGYVNYDDPEYLINNTHVQSGVTAESLAWAFKSSAAANWHPLTWVSHMLDCQWFGGDLRGHHFTSVLLHALNAVLLVLLLRTLTGQWTCGLFVAAIFAVHPLRVESVVWLSERKDVLSGFFGLAALLSYAVCHRRPTGDGSPGAATTLKTSRLWPAGAGLAYSLTLVLFLLGLMSKPMLVTLPFVMLLLDYWPLKRLERGFWRLVWEKMPFLVLSGAVCVITVLVQRAGGAMTLMAQEPWMARLENAAVSYCRYLGKFCWPDNLSPIYPVVGDWPFPLVAGCVTLLLAASVAAMALRRRCPFLLVGWLWFLGTLFPVIGLVAVGEQAMADRYTYLSLIGITMLFIYGGYELTRRWRPAFWCLVPFCLAATVACIIATREQIAVWADSESLFRHALNVTRDNYGAHSNLAAALQEQGKLDEALIHYEEAVRLRPDSPETHNNLGVCLGGMGRLEAAMAAFREALRLRPDYADAQRNLGTALDQSGDLEGAIRHFSEAVRLAPNSAFAHNDLGIVLAKAGRLEEAVHEFREAIRLDAGYGKAHANLGQAYRLQGRLPEAELHFNEAARLNARQP